jgi:DNA polymerase-3 subunit alpha
MNRKAFGYSAAKWVNNNLNETSKKEKMYFGTFIDLKGQWIDTVHFPPSAKAFPFTGPGSYLIKGKVVEEYDFVSIEVMAMKRLAVADREKQESPKNINLPA